ncbi:hypothetical protein DL96DRAFT_1554484 [Flagelloscypha sp. PMI_526]|nr:hypothetical protein DL96DRAFT_1554484 [Flagelloscypha sp. PMI_526]
MLRRLTLDYVFARVPARSFHSILPSRRRHDEAFSVPSGVDLKQSLVRTRELPNWFLEPDSAYHSGLLDLPDNHWGKITQCRELYFGKCLIRRSGNGKGHELGNSYSCFYENATKYLWEYVFDPFVYNVQLGGQKQMTIMLQLVKSHDYWSFDDRIAQNHFYSLHDDVDVFLLCFPIDDEDARENLGEKWYEKFRPYAGDNTRFIVVGLRSDIRDDEDRIEELRQRRKAIMQTCQGQIFAKTAFHAEAYLECSAKTFEGVNEVFEKAVRLACSVIRLTLLNHA